VTDSLELVSAVAQSNKERLAKSSICRICSLEVSERRVLEQLIACGVPNTVIIHIASQMFSIEINGSIIAKHIDHLPAKLFMYKEIIERRAKEAGISPDDTASRLTPVAYIEMLLNDAAQTLIDNPKSTNAFVGMQAAKTLIDIEGNKASQEDVMLWVSKFRQLVGAMKTVCSQDQIDKILKVVEDE
jgi:hypothetical protein